MHRDSTGHILQLDDDSGDTLHRDATAGFLTEVNKELGLDSTGMALQDRVMTDMLLDDLEYPDGVYCRHHNWPVNDTARDQMIPVFLYYTITENIGALKRLWKAFKSRRFWYQNKDLPGPELISFFARGFNWWWLMPLVWLADFHLIVNAMTRCGWIPRWQHETQSWKRLDMDDVGDDVNLQLMLMTPRRWMSPAIYLAIWIYVNYRPHSYGSFHNFLRTQKEVNMADMSDLPRTYQEFLQNNVKTDCPAYIGAIRHYFRYESLANTEFFGLFHGPSRILIGGE